MNIIFNTSFTEDLQKLDKTIKITGFVFKDDITLDSSLWSITSSEEKDVDSIYNSDLNLLKLYIKNSDIIETTKGIIIFYNVEGENDEKVAFVLVNSKNLDDINLSAYGNLITINLNKYTIKSTIINNNNTENNKFVESIGFDAKNIFKIDSNSDNLVTLDSYTKLIRKSNAEIYPQSDNYNSWIDEVGRTWNEKTLIKVYKKDTFKVVVSDNTPLLNTVRKLNLKKHSDGVVKVFGTIEYDLYQSCKDKLELISSGIDEISGIDGVTISEVPGTNENNFRYTIDNVLRNINYYSMLLGATKTPACNFKASLSYYDPIQKKVISIESNEFRLVQGGNDTGYYITYDGTVYEEDDTDLFLFNSKAGDTNKFYIHVETDESAENIFKEFKILYEGDTKNDSGEVTRGKLGTYMDTLFKVDLSYTQVIGEVIVEVLVTSLTDSTDDDKWLPIVDNTSKLVKCSIYNKTSKKDYTSNFYFVQKAKESFVTCYYGLKNDYKKSENNIINLNHDWNKIYLTFFPEDNDELGNKSYWMVNKIDNELITIDDESGKINSDINLVDDSTWPQKFYSTKLNLSDIPDTVITPKSYGKIYIYRLASDSEKIELSDWETAATISTTEFEVTKNGEDPKLEIDTTSIPEFISKIDTYHFNVKSNCPYTVELGINGYGILYSNRDGSTINYDYRFSLYGETSINEDLTSFTSYNYNMDSGNEIYFNIKDIAHTKELKQIAYITVTSTLNTSLSKKVWISIKADEDSSTAEIKLIDYINLKSLGKRYSGNIPESVDTCTSIDKDIDIPYFGEFFFVPANTTGIVRVSCPVSILEYPLYIEDTSELSCGEYIDESDNIKRGNFSIDDIIIKTNYKGNFLNVEGNIGQNFIPKFGIKEDGTRGYLYHEFIIENTDETQLNYYPVSAEKFIEIDTFYNKESEYPLHPESNNSDRDEIIKKKKFFFVKEGIYPELKTTTLDGFKVEDTSKYEYVYNLVDLNEIDYLEAKNGVNRIGPEAKINIQVFSNYYFSNSIYSSMPYIKLNDNNSKLIYESDNINNDNPLSKFKSRSIKYVDYKECLEYNDNVYDISATPSSYLFSKDDNERIHTWFEDFFPIEEDNISNLEDVKIDIDYRHFPVPKSYELSWENEEGFTGDKSYVNSWFKPNKDLIIIDSDNCRLLTRHDFNLDFEVTIGSEYYKKNTPYINRFDSNYFDENEELSKGDIVFSLISHSFFNDITSFPEGIYILNQNGVLGRQAKNYSKKGSDLQLFAYYISAGQGTGINDNESKNILSSLAASNIFNVKKEVSLIVDSGNGVKLKPLYNIFNIPAEGGTYDTGMNYTITNNTLAGSITQSDCIIGTNSYNCTFNYTRVNQGNASGNFTVYGSSKIPNTAINIENSEDYLKYSKDSDSEEISIRVPSSEFNSSSDDDTRYIDGSISVNQSGCYTGLLYKDNEKGFIVLGNYDNEFIEYTVDNSETKIEFISGLIDITTEIAKNKKLLTPRITQISGDNCTILTNDTNYDPEINNCVITLPGINNSTKITNTYSFEIKDTKTEFKYNLKINQKPKTPYIHTDSTNSNYLIYLPDSSLLSKPITLITNIEDKNDIKCWDESIKYTLLDSPDYTSKNDVYYYLLNIKVDSNIDSTTVNRKYIRFYDEKATLGSCNSPQIITEQGYTSLLINKAGTDTFSYLADESKVGSSSNPIEISFSKTSAELGTSVPKFGFTIKRKTHRPSTLAIKAEETYNLLDTTSEYSTFNSEYCRIDNIVCTGSGVDNNYFSEIPTLNYIKKGDAGYNTSFPVIVVEYRLQDNITEGTEIYFNISADLYYKNFDKDYSLVETGDEIKRNLNLYFVIR